MPFGRLLSMAAQLARSIMSLPLWRPAPRRWLGALLVCPSLGTARERGKRDGSLCGPCGRPAICAARGAPFVVTLITLQIVIKLIKFQKKRGLPWARVDPTGALQVSGRNADKARSGKMKDGPVFQDIARFRGILFDRFLRPHNLTMSQGWVILHLVRENGLRQADLAARLDIATVTISKLIDRLVARGFVERRPDSKDRRTNRIFATERAHDVMRNMREAQKDVDAIANAGIDAAELETTLKVLGQMRENLKASLAAMQGEKEW